MSTVDRTGFATNKGCALVAAVESGLLNKTVLGYETKKFEQFWDLYQKYLDERDEAVNKARASK